MRRGHDLNRQQVLTRLLKGRQAAAVRDEFEAYLKARGVPAHEFQLHVPGLYDHVAKLVDLWQKDRVTLAERRRRTRAGMRVARNLRQAAKFIAAQPNTVFQRQRWVTAAGAEPLLFSTPACAGQGRHAAEILHHLATHAELEFNPYDGRPDSLQRFLIHCLDQQLRVVGSRRQRLSPNKLIAAIVSLVLGKLVVGREVARVIRPQRRRRYERS